MCVAACDSRRLCASTSGTVPGWSIARYGGYCLPSIVITTSLRCHLLAGSNAVERMRRAMASPNFTDQRRTVSYVSSMPRPASDSLAMRKYRHTA